MGTHNDAGVLHETIDSVLHQSLTNFQFVIVDDGSTDRDACDVLADFARRDPRIELVQKPNEGLTRALVDGCKVACGEFIARIDAGDVMTRKRLETQNSFLKQHLDCAFVAGWTEFNGPEWEALWLQKGRPLGQDSINPIPSDPHGDFGADISHHGAVMFRKSAYQKVGGYRSEFYYGQDWDLWYRLAEVGAFGNLPRVLYRARVFPNSISMTRKALQELFAECSEGAFRARLSGHDESPWLQRARLAQSDHQETKNISKVSNEPGLYFIGEALRRNGDIRCREYFKRAIWQSPTKPRAWVRLGQSLSISGSA